MLVLYIMLSIETHTLLLSAPPSFSRLSLYVWLYPPNRPGLPSSLFFFLFDGLPGLTVWRPAGVWIISTGIPGDERGVQGS